MLKRLIDSKTNLQKDESMEIENWQDENVIINLIIEAQHIAKKYIFKRSDIHEFHIKDFKNVLKKHQACNNMENYRYFNENLRKIIKKIILYDLAIIFTRENYNRDVGFPIQDELREERSRLDQLRREELKFLWIQKKCYIKY